MQRALLFSITSERKRAAADLEKSREKWKIHSLIILGRNNFTADKNKTQTKNFIASKLLILLSVDIFGTWQHALGELAN